MKITPIEIRQHTFEKAMRGYRVEEVDAFLASLSQEWERVVTEHKMLKMQLELAEKDLSKLKEVEMTLFRTLKTAEDTSTQITEQATQAAQEHIAQAQQQADELMADTRKRSALMVQDAENQARYVRETITNDLQAIEHDLRALERHRDNMIEQVRTLASNAMDSIDRFEKKFAKQALREKIGEMRDQVQEAIPPQALPADAEVPELDTQPPTDELADSEADQPDATAPTSDDNVVATIQPGDASPGDVSPGDALPDGTSSDANVVSADATTSESAPADVVAVPAAATTDTTPSAEAPTSTANPNDSLTDDEPVATTSAADERGQKKSGGSFFDDI